MSEAQRAALRNFRWASGVTDDSQNGTATSQQQSSVWSRWTSFAGSYVPLRSDERTNEEEAYFALSNWERLLGFGACLLGAAACFFVAFISLSFKPSKFALAFSLGSLLVMFGFSILIGPVAHMKHLFSKERLPFTIAYFGSLGLTIYFAIGVGSFIGSLLAGIFQVVTLVAYVLAYFPGGTATLRFGGQMALRGAGSLLPF
ncbi:hypothetical protein Clacol_007910 [Clathrus columnatus]|uniref:Protein transport protein SFT2 n=1 Tax=Clathrus columnatus TaxID=1419009 RepID=A0AAV5AKJ6_9AGAM|nr:hypothetical protein Clacol_007910 [Clathrus columnatus]